MNQQTQTNKIGWKEINLSDICLVDSGQGAPQGDKYFLGEEIFVRAGDLNKLTEIVFVGDFCEKITKEAIEKYKLRKFKKNSIVFPKSGMSIKTDNIALLKYDSYVVNHLAILECRGINPKFLFYYLKKNKISNLCNDTSYPSIRISDINNYKVLIPFSNGSPDLKEQERIVKILEEAEKQKERGKRIEELLDEYLKSVFYEMFYNKGFEEIDLGNKQYFEIQSGGTPSRTKKEYWENGEIPWVGSTACKDLPVNKSEQFITEKGLKNSSAKLFPKGTLLIALVGATIGKTGILNFECSTNQNIAGITIKDKEKINSTYLFFSLKGLYNQFISLSNASFKMANLSFIRSLKIPLPPLPLQQKFASIVEQIEKMKESVNKTKQNSEELFNSLVSKGFRGKL